LWKNDAVSHARSENVYIDKFIFARRPHSGAVDYVGRARSRPISVDFFTTFRHPLVYVLTSPKKEVAHVMSCSLLQFLCTACVFFVMRSSRAVNTFWRSSRAAALYRENCDKRMQYTTRAFNTTISCHSPLFQK